eukprot:TRINITY_DN75437_c0_g1_i1.p1 TRINITY_DN75437_c0_g1~~TRINITY_DN75437_c0_g1_i1.p1  ORF type:complete len:477 (+),score=43.10 TRINITY_DN75437_c0_g1_i1:54-1433(+)
MASLISSLKALWPIICMMGASVGFTMPIDIYVALNFFAQRHTDRPWFDIRCEETPHAKYCAAAVDDQVYWSNVAFFITCALNFALGPLIGALSDACGRKSILVIASSLALIPAIAEVSFVFFNVTLYAWYASTALQSLPILSVQLALVSDHIVNAGDRAVAFSYVMVAYELYVMSGMIFAYVFSIRASLVASLLVRSLLVLYQLFVLKEIRPKEKRKRMRDVPLTPWTGLGILFRTLPMKQLTFVFFVSTFVVSGFNKISSSYLVEAMNWIKDLNTLSLIVCQISVFVWITVALKPLMRAFGEVALLSVAESSSVLYNLLFYFVRAPYQVLTLQALMNGASSLIFPAIAALKGGMVDEGEQGHVQGAVQTVQGIANALGSLCFGYFFGYFDVHAKAYTGSLFLVGCLLHCVLIPVVFTLPRDVFQQSLSSDCCTSVGERTQTSSTESQGRTELLVDEGS